MISRILILGADGMLGRTFREALAGRPEASFVSRRDCDVLDDESVERALAGGPAAVINCTGWTDVDGAETDEAGADALNARAVARLAEACRRNEGVLVHYSTDYVFPGDAIVPYRTEAERDPINAYGRSKARGEEALEASGAEHLLLRTSWLYAPHGRNFVRSIAGAALERERLNVVDDQVGRPTSTATLAWATLELLDAGARGTFHVTDAGEPISWFDFAEAIVDRVRARFRRGAEVLPCRSDEHPRPAKRPAYSVLDLERTERAIGALPDWREALAAAAPRTLASIDPRQSERSPGEGRVRAQGGATR
jgi:dTDP-4-dehydrorhamnose reductase